MKRTVSLLKTPPHNGSAGVTHCAEQRAIADFLTKEKELDWLMVLSFIHLFQIVFQMGPKPGYDPGHDSFSGAKL